jgi:hypothetical protein
MTVLAAQHDRKQLGFTFIAEPNVTLNPLDVLDNGLDMRKSFF